MSCFIVVKRVICSVPLMSTANGEDRTLIHHFKLTGMFHRDESVDLMQIFLNGRLIPIWCFSEYLGQLVGLCMDPFIKILARGAVYLSSWHFQSFFFSTNKEKNTKFNLQKCRGHAHSVHIANILKSRFKHCVCRHRHHHCMISIFLQKIHKVHKLNISLEVHRGSTHPTNRAVKWSKKATTKQTDNKLNQNISLCI